MAAISDEAPLVNEWQRVGGRAGGTITAIAGADQAEGARRLFAGTMSGVYVSDDGGDSWRISNRNLTSPYVQALAASPAVSEDGTVFLGVVGGGAFKSFDRGDTWNQLAFWSTMPNVVAIGLSPAYDTDRMAFLGSDADGVFRSTNGGRSWNPSSNGLTGLSVQAVAVSPNFTNDQAVYAGIVDGGLCRSTDAGLIARPTSATFTSFVTLTRPVSQSTSISAPAPPSIQKGVMSGDWPVAGSGFLYDGV